MSGALSTISPEGVPQNASDEAIFDVNVDRNVLGS